MSHVTYTDLRANLAKYMDEVCDSHAPLHVTRQNARSVVLVSEEELQRSVESKDYFSIFPYGTRKEPKLLEKRFEYASNNTDMLGVPELRKLVRELT